MVTKTIELSEVIQEMRNVKTRMDKVIVEVYKQAKLKDKAEREYRIALAQEILKLKADGMQATLIPDTARGNTADLKFNRDIAKSLYDSARDSMETLRTEASLLQTISKYQDEL
ncbi:hypothetical protein V7150_16135 [Neobacillus drentensis]